MTLPSKEEWTQVMDEVERLRMQQQAELRQQQVQAELEAELARQQARWHAHSVTGIYGVQGSKGGRSIQGKTATMTIIDDPADPDFWNNTEYSDVAKHMRNALSRIITVRKDMEKMRDWRYTSPYHPKRWIRWLQKRKKPILDTLFFGPLFLGVLAFLGYMYMEVYRISGGHAVPAGISWGLLTAGYFWYRVKRL